MSDSLYTYAVARIRSKELTLLNAQAIDQLLAAKSYDECLRLLADRGWGDGEVAADDARLLAAEREKTWNLIGELVEDMSVFDVFLYANDYHNLKAAIKLVCTGESDFGVFISHGTVDSGAILEAVRAKEFGALPRRCAHPQRKRTTPCPRRATASFATLSLTAPRLKPSSAPGRRPTAS